MKLDESAEEIATEKSLPIVAVLAGEGRESWHVGDLERAATARGVHCRRVPFEGLESRVGEAGEFRVMAAGFQLEQADAVIVRTMPKGSLEQIIFRMDVLHRLEARGMRVVNSPRSLEAAIDKYLCTARLEGAGLSVPPTCVAQRAVDGERFYDLCDGDVVVKPLFGSEGQRVLRLRDRGSACTYFRTLEMRSEVIYLQKFVPHAGFDLRVFLCGGRVIGAMRRQAADGWKTNIAQGGTAVAVEASSEMEDLALRAAAAVGTEVAGVDLLPDADGRYWVLEVNGVPGWATLSRTCGIDVAGAVIDYALTPCQETPD